MNMAAHEEAGVGGKAVAVVIMWEDWREAPHVVGVIMARAIGGLLTQTTACLRWMR